MELFKSGANYGQLADPTISGAQVNSVCGDKMTLQLKLEHGRVIDAKFHGVSCAVSKTAASIITESFKGKSIKELKKLTEKAVLDLINFDLLASRKQCALLCYYALQDALKKYDQTTKAGK